MCLMPFFVTKLSL